MPNQKLHNDVAVLHLPLPVGTDRKQFRSAGTDYAPQK
jgi:hypothetical protein